tara:strand:- start:99 stop:518 length:420 start_codon:yes stop_codon:yes gene_type:complete
MEFWLVARVWSSRTWNFIKKYWQIFAGIIYTIFVWVYFKGKSDKVKEVLEVEKQSHQKELDTLNNSHAEEIALRDGALAKYHEIIAEIEKRYENKKEELSDKKRTEVRKLVAENSEDPSNLSKLLSERFGITYVESGEE